MKKILILGAGQSTPSLINYMLKVAEEKGWFVKVCDMNLSLAQQRVGNSAFGEAVSFDVNDETQRNTLIKECDVVLNLLSPAFQLMVALDCLSHETHCITASYENLGIRDLHKDAQRKGILILNEMGLDPGIDHMSAMALIQKIRDRGGIIKSFVAYGGALPAPEVDSNPLRYCITWNARNVTMSGENGAQFMENNKMKLLGHHEIFQRTWPVEISGIGTFEAYPNRDSLVYLDVFDLKSVDTMIRGTLRYPGWSEMWSQIIKLGMPMESIPIPNVQEMTYAEWTEMFLPLNASSTSLRTRVANFLGISPTGKIMDHLNWFGLFSDKKIGGEGTTSAEVLTELLIKKLPLPPGGRDMVILINDIVAQYPKENNRREKTVSTLVEYGEPNGFTAIANTVGLPAAIAARLLLEGDLPVTGCQIPTHPVVYTKVLAELEKIGLKIKEETWNLPD